ncbi:MAG: transposase, partial [Opitutaceae bacterium]|nr:transposase [Opitutaceae bacterium]
MFVGIDEKSFRRGQSYISLMFDIKGSRVLDVVEGRDTQAVVKLWKTLEEEEIKNIK